MKRLIYELRFTIYAFFVAYFVSNIVIDTFNMTLVPHMIACVLIIIALYPIVKKLDDTYVKKVENL